MRYFLVDRVTELVVGERIRGVKNVTLTDEILHDHFPDYPIFPGALILEAGAQLAGFLLEATLKRAGEPARRALLAQIRDAKFHMACGPGDQLLIEARMGPKIGDAVRMDVEVRVKDDLVTRAQLTFMTAPIESERLHEQRRYVYRLWTRDLKPPVDIP
ncbi:MAG: beta-hydroxyacyl-ACP dehydratase [Planctomycetes bacterium]|nr:beta-hydroxyacyl-ACP dehydratase [Planctomycetota bacterium]